MRWNRVLLFVLLGALIATHIIAQETQAVVRGTDGVSLSVDELKRAEALFNRIVEATDATSREIIAKQMIAIMTADPPTAVLWELWLRGKQMEIKDRRDVIDSLPAHLALRAALAGEFEYDLAYNAKWMWEAQNPGEEGDLEDWLGEMDEDAIATCNQFKFTFFADGRVQAPGDGKSPSVGNIRFGENGRFTLVFDKDENSKVYLRGQYKDGELWMKVPFDVVEIAMAFRFHRVKTNPRLEIAAVLAPLLNAAEVNTAVPTPQFAGTYRAGDDGYLLTIHTDGTFAMTMQVGDETRSACTGRATRVTKEYADFQYEAGFHTTVSNAAIENETNIGTFTIRKNGHALTLIEKLADGTEQTAEWGRLK